MNKILDKQILKKIFVMIGMMSLIGGTFIAIMTYANIGFSDKFFSTWYSSLFFTILVMMPLGAVIMFMLSMISNIGLDFQTEILSTSLWIMFWYLIAQLVDNFASQPLIFSKTTKSHPLEIFLIIIIGGLLFGIVGMITAVPMYTALKVILKEFLSDNKIVKSLTKDL